MKKWLYSMIISFAVLNNADAQQAQQVIVQQPPQQQQPQPQPQPQQQPNQVIVKLPPQQVFVEDRPACVVNTMPVFDPQGNFVGYTSTKVCN
jgi:hypothetical protein